MFHIPAGKDYQICMNWMKNHITTEAFIYKILEVGRVYQSYHANKDLYMDTT